MLLCRHIIERKGFSYETHPQDVLDRPPMTLYVCPKPTHVKVHPGTHVLQFAVGTSELREVAGFRGPQDARGGERRSVPAGRIPNDALVVDCCRKGAV